MNLTPMLRTPAVAAGAAILVLSGGGIALASSTGALDVPFTGHDNRSAHAPAAPASTNPGLTKAGSVVGTPESDETEAPDPSEPGESTETESAAPTPSLEGLCNAFQHGAFQHGKSQAFAALAAAAGGNSNVGGFCTSLIGTPKPHPAKPTQAAHPSHPAAPTHPVTPVTPTHPAKPTQAATPDIPGHPAPHAH